MAVRGPPNVIREETGVAARKPPSVIREAGWLSESLPISLQRPSAADLDAAVKR